MKIQKSNNSFVTLGTLASQSNTMTSFAFGVLHQREDFFHFFIFLCGEFNEGNVTFLKDRRITER